MRFEPEHTGRRVRSKVNAHRARRPTDLAGCRCGNAVLYLVVCDLRESRMLLVTCERDHVPGTELRRCREPVELGATGVKARRFRRPFVVAGLCDLRFASH